jgi:hypothetical protein
MKHKLATLIHTYTKAFGGLMIVSTIYVLSGQWLVPFIGYAVGVTLGALYNKLTS